MSPSIASKLRTIATGIERFTQLTGEWVAWLFPIMVLIQCTVVTLRYGFDIGSIALQESVIYLHACCFLLGAAYTLKMDEHVRVDIFYRNFSTRRKAWVNLLGSVLFLLPCCLAIIWLSSDYVLQSWQIQERSADSGGLGIVFLLKSLIPLFAFSLLLQAIAEAIRAGLGVFYPSPDEHLDRQANITGSI